MLRKHCEQIGCNREAHRVFKSLFMPTLFDPSSDDMAGLVAAAVKQNVKGSWINPLTSTQWVHLTLQAAGLSDIDYGSLSFENVPARKQVGATLVKTFDSILSSYHTSVEKEGVVQTVVPAAKRTRKLRGGRPADAKAKASRILACNELACRIQSVTVQKLQPFNFVL